MKARVNFHCLILGNCTTFVHQYKAMSPISINNDRATATSISQTSVSISYSECGRGGGCYLLRKEPITDCIGELMLGLNSAAGSREQPPSYSGIKDAASPVTSDGQGWCGLQRHKDQGSFQVVFRLGYQSQGRFRTQKSPGRVSVYQPASRGKREKGTPLLEDTSYTSHQVTPDIAPQIQKWNLHWWSGSPMSS